MTASATAQSIQAHWERASADNIELDATGRIIDYLDPARTRPDRPEERVRQAYARVLVEEYGYPVDLLALEVPVKIGSETRAADIAVYDSPESRTAREQGRIRLIIETKAPNEVAGQAQLTSYIFATSADGGVWTNGGTPAYFRRVELPHPQLRRWTNIPRLGETWDTVGHYRKSDLAPPRNLKQVFRRCHNAIFRRGLDSEDIALDMVRIILAKYRDEQNPGDQCEFRCTPEEFETADGRSSAGVRVRRLFATVVADNPDVFPPEDQITIGDDGLAAVVNELQPFKFLADEDTEEVYDVIGTAFEVYVAAHLKGDRGQYFTNRLVVNLMVEMLDPDERDIVLDPACGSGGFLIAVLRHVRRKIVSSSRTAAAVRRELQAATQRLIGIEIAPKLVRVAKTNMILNGDGHGGIVRGDTLGAPSELSASFHLRPEAGAQAPTLVFTNPPFGASHDLRVRQSDVLERLQLGHVWEAGDGGWLRVTSAVNSGEGVPPEILFLERCIDFLAPRGRLAIVLARGVLDNREALAARQLVQPGGSLSTVRPSAACLGRST